MIRMSEEEIYKYDTEYGDTYPLYTAISSVVEEYEGVKDGLRAPEVWREVLKLEQRLSERKRPDKFIFSERTRLTKEFKRFKKVIGNKTCWETAEDRNVKDVERSVMCILLAFGMRLGSYYEDKPNPYESIMCNIREMALQCSDLQMVADLTNKYYDSEDEEEKMGNFVPEEDVLHCSNHSKLPKELEKTQDMAKVVFDYFYNALESEDRISKGISIEQFEGIWKDLLNNEDILRIFSDTSSKIKNTLKDTDIEKGMKEYVVKGNDYNLILVLNILGMLIEHKVISSNISQTRKMFFPDAKDTYFKPSNYKHFGSSSSAFPTENVYNKVVKIIQDNIK